MFDVYCWNGKKRILCAGISQSAPKTSTFLDLHSAKNSPFSLAYSSDYVLQYFAESRSAGLAKTLPLSLFEVYTGERVAKWASQFSPLSIQQISPVSTITHICIEAVDTSNEKVSLNDESIIFDLDTLFTDHDSQRQLHKTVGWFAGQQFCFGFRVKNGFRLHAYDDFERPDQCIMFPYRVMQACIQGVTQQLSLEILQSHTAFHHALNQLLLPEVIADESDAWFIPRIDVDSVGLDSSLRPVLFALDEVPQQSKDLLGATRYLVSTYFKSDEVHLNRVVSQILQRDIITRCFVDCHQRNAFVLMNSQNTYSFTPVIWDIDGNPMLDSEALDWPDFLVRDGHPDYPMICNALADIVQPDNVLMDLLTFVEQLILLPEVLDNYPNYVKGALLNDVELEQLMSRIKQLGLLL